jgi:hypothetical protein
MRERQESGLSIKEFCETSGFHENVYFYWQRKLREAACKALLSARAEGNEASAAPQGWAMVCEVPKTEPDSGAVYIEIGKCRVTAAPGFDLAHLTNVCRALMTLC